jgi:hypothetical protein
MGKSYDAIDDSLREFIQAQKMFFVATAPLAADGLVNLSPKGLDAFRILDPHTVAYLDLTGSGIETVAHLKENRRIVFMFCAFEGPPKILRLYGRGEVHQVGSPGFDELRGQFPDLPGSRSIIRVEVHRITDSCGWGVPLYSFEAERDQLPRFAERFSEEETLKIQQTANAKSLDGLTGIEVLS